LVKTRNCHEIHSNNSQKLNFKLFLKRIEQCLEIEKC